MDPYYVFDSLADSSVFKASTIETAIIRKDVDDLEKRLDKLLLLSQAMWELLKEKTNLTETDLAEKVTELDLRDGKIDGKYTKPLIKCSKCESAICYKYDKCLFCGTPYEKGETFDQV